MALSVGLQNFLKILEMRFRDYHYMEYALRGCDLFLPSRTCCTIDAAKVMTIFITSSVFKLEKSYLYQNGVEFY